MIALGKEEQAMLAGEMGAGVQKAIEIVVALGKIYGAEDLVPVESVQVAGVSYKNLGQAGLLFLREWAEQGGQVRVPTFLNPAGMDLKRWKQLGFDAEFADQQHQVIEAFSAMGINTTCTCTPYLIGQVPAKSTHVAWSESSAVSFANSVLGARTNREGGPSALAAAICGRTARYGLHLKENRVATIEVIVNCPIRGTADWGALGYLVGKRARNQIPFFRLQRNFKFGCRDQLRPPEIQGQETKKWDALKALGAAMAASGAVALYHIDGITPESRTGNMLASQHETWTIDSLEPAYQALSGKTGRIDLVWLGCPHASLAEIERLARFARGKRFIPDVWITTSRAIREEAEKQGLVATIESAGGEVVADTCVVVAPVGNKYRTMATSSAKGGYYAPSYLGMSVRYGTWEQLEAAMVSGQWETDT